MKWIGICKKSEKQNKRKLAVDHCHTKNTIRGGLLCSRCNMGIGIFRDDPILLENAIKYLQINKHGDKNEFS